MGPILGESWASWAEGENFAQFQIDLAFYYASPGTGRLHSPDKGRGTGDGG